jgi:ribosomal-protein-alanine N-acetyltransferase
MTGDDCVGPEQPVVTIVEPGHAHRREFLAAARRSRDLHGRWVEPPSTDIEFSEYLRRVSQPSHFGYLLVAESELAGVVNINNVVMASLRSGHLGYYSFAGFERRGLMTVGLRLVLRTAFNVLGLHRVEANIQPGNERSIRLVKRVGFTKEGFSERYLHVAGEWRDHERWALRAEQFRLDGGEGHGLPH